MALIIGNPKFQWFVSSTGEPAVGYLLYSYEAGTVTPTNTWQDTDLSILNTNPIELDSMGSANVVISGLTKLVLKDPDGATIWSFDDIGSAGSNIDGFLTFTTTPSAVNYLNITNAATGNPPILASKGGDSNVGLTITTKGTGALALSSSSGAVSITGTTVSLTGTVNVVGGVIKNNGGASVTVPTVATTGPTSQATINNQALICSTAGVQSYSALAQPTADGVAGDVMQTNGSAVLSMAAAPPTGSMVIWTTTSAPSGYLECDGSAVSRTTYARLFAVIGTTFGVGNGTTTFNLPQTQRQVIVGRGGTAVNASLANTLGSQYGEEQHTLVQAEIPAHTHGSVVSSSSGANTISGSGTVGVGSTGSYGGGGAHNNLQPSLVLMYIIKT